MLWYYVTICFVFVLVNTLRSGPSDLIKELAPCGSPPKVFWPVLIRQFIFLQFSSVLLV